MQRKRKAVTPTLRRLTYAGILALGLIWIGLSAEPAGSTTAGKIPAPQKGFLAPDFSLATLDGGEVRLSDLRGQAVLLNLWATWCPPCQAEMPAIQRVYENYKDQGFTVLAVNVTHQDQLSAIGPFAQQYRLTFPILLDKTGEVSELYLLRSLPSSFFIGKDGVIRELVVGGPMAEALIRSRVEAMLGEQP